MNITLPDRNYDISSRKKLQAAIDQTAADIDWFRRVINDLETRLNALELFSGDEGDHSHE